jgi:hypothetical protein
MCHWDPLMTDGLANEIEFGFEWDARMRRARRIGNQLAINRVETGRTKSLSS